jgi:hypothetical protein
MCDYCFSAQPDLCSGGPELSENVGYMPVHLRLGFCKFWNLLLLWVVSGKESDFQGIKMNIQKIQRGGSRAPDFMVTLDILIL